MTAEFGWPDVLPREVYSELTQLETLDPWFEIYELVDDVYAIYEPFHFEETISFLMLGSDRAVLVDTGMGIADIRAEVENITDLPIVVINTHWHYDHIGSNYQFNEVWAFDNDFEVGKIERGMTVEELAGKLAPDMVCGDFPAAFDPDHYEVRGSRVTRRLSNLETLDLGNRELVVHHTPGHSPGSICLYDRTDRILYTGDTYYPGTMYANLERSCFSDYYASMQYLASMIPDIAFVAPSHNEATVPPQELADALEAFRAIRCGEAEYEVKNGTRVYRFERFLLEYPDEKGAPA